MKLVGLSILIFALVISCQGAAVGGESPGNSGNAAENGNKGGNGNDAEQERGSGTYQLFADMDINEDVTCVCDRLPDEASLANSEDFYKLSGCEKNSDLPACQDAENLDLSILTSHIRCFKSACAETNEGQKKKELEKCVVRMRDVIYNFLQFSVPDPLPQKQLEKSCKCKYAENDNENFNKDAYCALKHASNCNHNDATCFNTDAILANYGCCEMEGKDQKECFDKVAGRVKAGRIKMYCSHGLSVMLKNENVGNKTCEETVSHKATLKNACSDNCYINIKDQFDDAELEQLVVLDDYGLTSCGAFSEVVNDVQYNFLSETVYYKGRRDVWAQTLDICIEYKRNGRMPQCLAASPYVRPFLTSAQMLEVVDKCCQNELENYEEMRAGRDANEEDISGLKEAICMNDNGVMNDFGFTSGLLRSIVKESSGDCWDCIPSVCTPNSNPSEVGPPCSGATELQQPMLCDEETLSPQGIYWFLKYLKTTEQKAYALKACANGAQAGKGITAFSGVAMGAEAQVQGLGADYPNGFKVIGILATHHCGVTAALEANDYFDETGKNECNPNVFPISEAARTSC